MMIDPEAWKKQVAIVAGNFAAMRAIRSHAETILAMRETGIANAHACLGKMAERERERAV